MATENGDRRTVASLGCGTLIIIALIVMFLSGGNAVELGNQIAVLNKRVESLTDEVESLRLEQARSHRLLESLVLTLEPGAAPGSAPDPVSPVPVSPVPVEEPTSHN